MYGNYSKLLKTIHIYCDKTLCIILNIYRVITAKLQKNFSNQSSKEDENFVIGNRGQNADRDAFGEKISTDWINESMSTVTRENVRRYKNLGVDSPANIPGLDPPVNILGLDDDFPDLITRSTISLLEP